MAAIVSSGSLGLLHSSLAVLGSQGQLGASTHGRAGERVYVNAATGNLVLQGQDEILIGRGPDAALFRTYNSQGLLDDDNGDNWRIGFYRRVHSLTGTANAAGSTVRRTDADGASALYTYDAALGKYITGEGEGAYDTLAYNAATQVWTWTDGTTGVTELYDGANGGRLTQVIDRSGNAISFTYTGALLTAVQTASGETTFLDYTGTNLTQLRTVASGGATLIRTRYSYDASNRLTQAVTDLSPADQSIADGKTYATSYTYDGTSRRVATMTQTDGTSLTFSYVLVGSDYRVSQINASGRVTAFAYNTAARTTTVTDPLNRSTVLAYDTSNRLTGVTMPSVGGVAQQLSYAYDASGNVTSVTDAKGNAVVYAYDARGNRVHERDAAGNVVERVYGTGNQLLAETQYLVPDPDGAGASQPSTPLTARYVYDSNTRLRFEVSAVGRVTEHRYNGSGQRVATIQYAEATYSLVGLTPTSTLTEAQLTAWLPADRSKSMRADTAYDFRGQVSTVTTFAAVDAAGNGVANGTQAVTQFIYDQAGNLLQTVDARGTATPQAGDFQTTYVYDGLGRLLSTTNALGQLTVSNYQDANRKTIITLANGLLRTSTYSAAGDLISVLESADSVNLGETKYFYDGNGRLRRTEDPTGVKSHVLYDEAGRRVAEIDGDGSLTEYRYDANNNLTRTIRYANAVSATALATLADAQGVPQNVSLASIRPAAQAGDRSTWAAYDAANRLVKTVDALGAVVQRFYDGASRLTDELRYATAISTAALGDTPAGSAIAPASNAADRLTRNFYDAQGKLLGTLDSEGYLVEYKYDAAGQLVDTVGYATATNATLRAQGTLAQLVPATNAADIHSYRFYNASGQLARSIDAEGYLTEYNYDAAGNKTGETRYAVKTTARALTLTGVSGVYASTPDSPVNSIIGDIELVAKVAPDSWTGSFQHIIAKRSTNNQSYALRIAPSGQLEIVKGSASGGTTVWIVASASAPSLVAGQAKWVKGRIDVDNGAGGAVISFWASDDGLAWTSIGSSTVAGAAGPMFDGTNPLEIGSAFNGTDRPFKGKIYYADIRNGIDGPIIAKFDPAMDAPAAASTSFRSSTGEVWTLSGVASIGTLASAQDQLTTSAYDALNRLVSETKPDGTVTTYEYDQVGNLTRKVKAANTADVRTPSARYDRQGRLTGELSGNGAALITGGQTQAQIDAIWAQHALWHTYDAAGRRTSTTDALGNRTLFYYNADGALTHTINAQGEVKESRYNRLGQLTETVEYGARIGATALATLNGGLTDAAFAAGLAALANAQTDSHSFATYHASGRVNVTTDALGNTTSRSYNAFSDLVGTSQALGGGQTLEHSYAYDKRGLLTLTAWDPSGINKTAAAQYDAFGRAVQTTDGNGNVRTKSYDRLGRVITLVEPGSVSRSTTYDAFDRVLTQSDALGNLTTYSYNTATRSVTVTTPEGVSVTSVRTRHGETLSVTDGRGGITTYAYDKNGNVVSTTDAASKVSTRAYDAANRLLETLDASGNRVAYSYDAANRLFMRRVDPTGLNLTTTYAYDAKGQSITVTDPNGVVTAMTYDLEGQLTEVRVDPAGLNLRTTYTYDARGNKLTVTTGAGTPAARVTQYAYDKLGRLTSERVDPAGLNLTTSYAYDKNDNVVSRTDAKGSVTRYYYDARDQRVYTLDALKGLVKSVYDANGRVTQTLAYANALSGLPANPTLANVEAAIQADAARDSVTRSVYDRDGREVYTVDALWGVTKKTYDGNGNVVEMIAYATPIASTTALTIAGINAAVATAAGDRRTRVVYDALNRALYSIDALGAVVQNVYADNGNLLRTVAYANLISITGQPTAAQVAAALVPNAAADSATRNVYDKANRLVYAVDALGYVKETRYDAGGRITSTIQYAQAVTLGATPTAAEVAAALQAQPGGLPNQVNGFTYDAAGRLVSSVDAEGFTESFTYDAQGNKLTFTNKKGATWNYAYDANGRLVSETSPQVAVTRLQSWTQDFSAGASGLSGDGLSNPAFMRVENGRLVVGTPSVTPAIWPNLMGDRTYPVASGALFRAEVNTGPSSNGRSLVIGASNEGQSIPAYRRLAAYFVGGFVYANYYDPASTWTSVQLGAFKDNTTYVVEVQTGTSGATLFVYELNRDRAGGFSYTSAFNDWGYARSVMWTLGNTGQPASTMYVDNLSETAAAITTEAVTTAITYDALGNVLSRTEAYGRPEARTTQYQYDALGRQTKTILPSVATYNAAADNLSTNGLNGTVARTETTISPETSVTYNALGKAVVNRDAAGSYSYKVYDTLGRLRYDIDAERYVVEYRYDALGNQTQLIRYATQISFAAHTDPAAPFTATEVAGLIAANAQDRALLTSFDKLGRITEVLEPSAYNFDPTAPAGSQYFTAGRTTKNTYDAFGTVVKQSTLKNPLTAEWADTYVYYDRRGKKIAQVDPLGYLTKWEYDETGDVVREVQYAAALAPASWSLSGFPASPVTTTPTANPGSAIGYDREVTYAYDRKNQKVSETRVNVEFGQVTGTLTLSNAVGNLTTTYGYDAVGNMVRVTDPAGASTYTYFDALGRTTAVADPSRVSESTTAAVVIPPVYVSYDSGANSATLSFAKQASGGTTVAFRYAKAGTTSWISATPQVQGTSYVVALTGATSDRYIYEITYTLAGQGTPYATGSGAFSVLGPTSVAATHIATTVEQPSVNGSIAASSHFDQVPNGEGGYQPQWNGYSQVNLSWSSLNALGNGNVRVRVNYATYAYEAVGDNGEGGYVYGVTNNGANTSREVTYTAAQAATGVTIAWSEGQPGGVTSFGVRAINSIQVWKVVDGTEILVHSAAPGTTGAERLLVRGKTAGLTGINVAGVGTLAATSLGAGVYAVNLGGLSRGTYQFTAVGTTSTIGGEFQVSKTTVAGNAGVQELNGGTGSAVLSAYNLPAAAASAVLQYRLAGETGPYLSKQLNGGSGSFSIPYDDVANGSYEFLLTVKDSGGNAVNLTSVGGTAAGTLSGTLKVVRGAQSLPSVVRNSSSVEVTPLTTMRHDVHGNVVQTTLHAKGTTGAGVAGYGIPTADANDQTSYEFFDAHGRVVRSVDASGASRHRSYDALGNVAKTWQPVTANDGLAQNAVQAFQYDKLGRQTVTIDPWYLPSQTLPAARTQAQYNAFGEVIAKGLNDGWQEYYHYDNAGRLWRTNDADGVARVNLYNVQGKATAEIRSQGRNLATYASAQDVAALTTDVQRTNTHYDVLGRTIKQVEQTFMAPQALDPIPGSISMPAMSLGWGIAQQGYFVNQESGSYWVPNIVNVSWNEMASWGGGNVYIRVYYWERVVTGGDAESGYTYGPGAHKSVDFEIGNTATGTSVSWTGDTIYAVNVVHVWKRDASNNLVQLHTQGGTSGHSLLWQAPTAVGTQVTFKYKLSSSGTWLTGATNNFGVYRQFDTRGLGAGTYNYEILYAGPGATEPYAHKTGNFVVGAGAGVSDTTVTASDPVTPVSQQTLDRWGNVLTNTDQRGFVTTYRYNQDNRLIEDRKPLTTVWAANGTSSLAQPLLRNFYDKLGNAIGTIDANGNPNTARYDAAGQLVAEYHVDGGVLVHNYDVLGRRVRSLDALGNATDYTYDRADRLIRERRPIGEDNYAYDEQGNRTSSTDGLGRTTSYWYDTRGKMIRTRLPGGQQTNASYDLRGNKISEVNANNHTASWGYDYFGRSTAHTDLGGATHTYAYNFAGQLTQQTNSRGMNQTLSYYENGRLKQLNDLALNTQTFYQHDAAGNRTREKFIKAGILHLDNRIAYDELNRVTRVADNRYTITYAYDANGNRRKAVSDYYDINNTLKHVENWYLYDSMNRITLSQGALSAGTIQINTSQGIQLQYDANGNRRMATSYQGGALVSEAYNYDANNRLTTTTRGGLTTSSREYDAAGQVWRTISYSSPGVISERRDTTYNSNGWVTMQDAFNGAGTHLQRTLHTGYDAVGNATSYQVSTYTGFAYTNYYSYQYAAFEGYEEYVVNGSSTYFQPGNTTTNYDVNGNVVSVSESFATSRNRSFVSLTSGQILQKTENGQTQYYFYVNDKPIGSSGALGAADFDYNYTPVSAQYPAATPGNYVVSQGDTLRSIALSLFGDGQLWFIIADANGLRNDSDLKVGQRLTIPNRITNLHNNNKTFKVYNGGQIIGDTTPTLPDPPPPPPPPKPKKKRGIFGGFTKIISIIIQAVATYYLGPILGNLVGQLANNILGLQKGFDLKSLAVSAVTAGITQGLGIQAPAAGQSFGTQMLNAAATETISQGVRIAAGMQSKFDWKSVAISAIGAPLANAAGSAASSAFDSGSFMGEVAGGFARNLTQQGVSAAFGRGKIDFGRAAAGALAGGLDSKFYETNPIFGGGLGGYVAGQLSSRLIRDAASGGNVDIRRQMADDFGNQLGNALVGQSMRASQQQAQIAQAYAYARDLEDAEIGRAMRQAEFERTVAENQEREQAEIGLGGVEGVDLGIGGPDLVIPSASSFAEDMEMRKAGLGLRNAIYREGIDDGILVPVYKFDEHKSLAAVAAGEVFTGDQSLTKRELEALRDGSIWPDMPNADPTSIKPDWRPFLGMFARKEIGLSIDGYTNTLVYRSHFGDLQYWHSMSPSSSMTNMEVRERIIGQMLEWYQHASNAEDRTVGLFHIGKILHTVHDSYSPSHTVRNADGEVQQFQDYRLQDGDLHGQPDKVPESDRSGRYENYYYARAREASVKVLGLYNQGASPDQFERMLRTEIFRLQADRVDVPSGGTLERFAPTPQPRFYPGDPWPHPISPFGVGA
jgi:YD repeat-containing protein